MLSKKDAGQPCVMGECVAYRADVVVQVKSLFGSGYCFSKSAASVSRDNRPGAGGPRLEPLPGRGRLHALSSDFRCRGACRRQQFLLALAGWKPHRPATLRTKVTALCPVGL